MIYKVSLFITLLCLAAVFAQTAGWISTDLVFIAKVGVIAAIVAGVALLLGK